MSEERRSGADESFQEVGNGSWRLSRSRFSIINDEHKWTLKFYDGNPHKAHDHAQIQENCERLCFTLNHIQQLERDLATARKERDAIQRKHDELGSILIAAKVKTQAIEREIINPRIREARAQVVELAEMVEDVVPLYVAAQNTLASLRAWEKRLDAVYQRAVALKRGATSEAPAA